jgi:hypothetical protein
MGGRDRVLADAEADALPDEDEDEYAEEDDDAAAAACVKLRGTELLSRLELRMRSIMLAGDWAALGGWPGAA